MIALQALPAAGNSALGFCVLVRSTSFSAIFGAGRMRFHVGKLTDGSSINTHH